MTTISISSLHNADAEEVLWFVCERFVADSVLHHALGLQAKEYQRYLRQSFYTMVAEGLSFIARDNTTQELLGCIVATEMQPLAQICEPTTTEPNEEGTANTSAEQETTSLSTQKTLAPLNALLNQLDAAYHQYRRVQQRQVILVDIAVVDRKARGIGLYKKLREQVHQAGRQQGFKYVVGELSSCATQRYCVDTLNASVIADIHYASFCYNGYYPFAAITDPPSIQLVESTLINNTYR